MLLSIIIPVYNVEKYLAKCLDSVIYPDLQNYEIVCVNDGSKDSSRDILSRYHEKYPDIIRIIDRENGGLGAASNTGVENARGDYLVFLDSDDYYAPGAVAEMMQQCRDDIDICFFDLTPVNLAGQSLGYINGCTREEGDFTVDEYPEIIFASPSRNNKIFRRALFAETGIRFPGRVWFEDYRTTPKLYTLCGKMHYIHKSWYYYLQQPSSITHTANAQRNLEIIDAADEILKHYKAAGLFEKYKPQLEYSVFYNVLLTSVDRVNLIDHKSTVQDALVSFCVSNFPDYEKNPYFLSMPRKFKLIHFLIKNRQYFLLNCLLRANNKIKNK